MFSYRWLPVFDQFKLATSPLIMSIRYDKDAKIKGLRLPSKDDDLRILL